MFQILKTRSRSSDSIQIRSNNWELLKARNRGVISSHQKCKQHTVPHTLSTRNIFSRMAQERATLIRTRHCWILHFSLTHNAFLLFFNPLTVTMNHLIDGHRLFGRLATQSPLTGTAVSCALKVC